MNVRLQLADVIFSQVIGNTCVDRNLLLDNNEFTSLFTSLMNSKQEMIELDSSKIVNTLTDFVNNNY
jgi:hypothetical protein